MSSRHHRDQELQHRISRTVLIGPEGQKVPLPRTAVEQQQLEILRGLLLRADAAMEAEGIDRQTRDRVVHWILIGEPAPRWDQDPDAELDEAAHEQLKMHAARIQQLGVTPINTEGLT
ncbi:MAG TPA: hypothetical protein VFU74_21880 [Actinocrinis sp.]|nr:hypothetical protein [Actinocrinis sp.]